MENNPLHAFVTELLNKKEGEKDEEPRHTEVLNQLNEAIDRALLEALPEEQLTALDEAGESVDEAMLEKALQDAGVDAGRVIGDTMEQFQNDFLKGGE